MKPNQPHINNLIERCKKSDKNAQLDLYKAYYRAMYNTAHRILKDNFEAEDIMQEAFLTAFTKLDSYKGEVAFGAWTSKVNPTQCCINFALATGALCNCKSVHTWLGVGADSEANAQPLSYVASQQSLIAICGHQQNGGSNT